METPRVSIICPVYKVENYLSRCIESIIKQKYKNFELILVDDGSPDKSGDICEKYAAKDGRIKVVHKTNGGVSSARNYGIKHSKGEWISFVDSDDWIDEDFLNPIESIDNNVELIHQGKKMEYPNAGTIVKPLKSFGVFDAKDLFSSSKWCSYCWSFFFKRELLDKFQIVFNEQLKFSEDRLFIMQYVMVSSKMLFVPSTSYHYFFNSESACNSVRDAQTYYDDLVVIKSFINFLQKYNLDISDHEAEFVLGVSIAGMKSDLSPYYSIVKRKLIVNELLTCREIVQKRFENRFDYMFASFIKWPRLTLMFTYYKPQINRIIKKMFPKVR